MAFEKQLLALATLNYEMLDDYLKTNPSLLNIFGGDIRKNAQNKDEFIEAAFDFLELSMQKAKALMAPVNIDYNRCMFVTKILNYYLNLKRVDREEYARLLSLRWDKEHQACD